MYNLPVSAFASVNSVYVCVCVRFDSRGVLSSSNLSKIRKIKHEYNYVMTYTHCGILKFLKRKYIKLSSKYDSEYVPGLARK